MAQLTFLDMAKRAGERCESAYRSFSGTDVAEAELYRLERVCWLNLNNGWTLEASLWKFDADWRKYAAENNAKVTAAGKIRRGPRAGQSCIEHRWVSPELAECKSNHIRAMAKDMKAGKFDEVTKSIIPIE